MFQRRRKLSAEETKANADRREARKQAAMTCQCCGNKILANKGVIAHHGYQRPGDGWQTASCFGARELPFEVDRTKLGELIAILKDRVASMKVTRAEYAAEKHPLEKSFYNRKKTREAKAANRWAKDVHDKISFTRATFKQVIDQAKTDELLDGYNHICMEQKGFDEYLRHELDARDARIKFIETDIKNCQKRYGEWKQTHKRENEQWVKL